MSPKFWPSTSKVDFFYVIPLIPAQIPITYHARVAIPQCDLSEGFLTQAIIAPNIPTTVAVKAVIAKKTDFIRNNKIHEQRRLLCVNF